MGLTKPALTDIAYFSMEIMLETDIPTYAGGLGILAGDILRSCADMEVSAVGVSLIYNGAIFSQKIQSDGSQSFNQVEWRKLDQLTKLTNRITLHIKSEDIQVGVWRYDIVGLTGHVVPIYLLDTTLPENSQWAQEITQSLYGDQGGIRLSQEIVLGIGGVKMLRALGYHEINSYHLNEGHSALVPLALLEEREYKDEHVRPLCTFTTHTPIPEGHDTFDYDFAYQYADSYLPWHIRTIASEEKLHMTKLGMNMSKQSNAVSQKHKLVMEHDFPGYSFQAITNGVHHRSWIAPQLQDVYERFMPGTAQDPGKLKRATENLPGDVLWDTHQLAKKDLIDFTNRQRNNRAGSEMNEDDYFNQDTLTIALARRPVAYKRPLLLYKDLERLVEIGRGKVQIIQCGKSHPYDQASQNIVQEIVQISRKLQGAVRLEYLEDYSPRVAQLLVAGADVWLNTPMQPLEASGTSGMKAAMNGVLNFSVPDGWWLEGFRMAPDAGFVIGTEIEGLTAEFDDEADATSIYDQLQNVILPLYYNNRGEWLRRMKVAISLGSYFNTHRCVREYKKYAWES